MEVAATSAWQDAAIAASLLAADPALGGAVVRGGPGPVRDAWLEALRAGLPFGAPVRRVPLHASEEQLQGGLDLAATLRAGRPVALRGLLAAAVGGVLVLAMAERVEPDAAARLAHALDTPGTRLVALDESEDDDAPPPDGLLDRLAFHIDLRAVRWRETEASVLCSVSDAGASRAVAVPDAIRDALCATALALGVFPLRASLLALRAARAAAALAGRDCVEAADAELATRLVLAPRATVMPAPPEAPPPPTDPQDGHEGDNQGDGDQDHPTESPPRSEPPLGDLLLEAARAALPSHVLAGLAGEAARSARGGT